MPGIALKDWLPSKKRTKPRPKRYRREFRQYNPMLVAMVGVTRMLRRIEKRSTNAFAVRDAAAATTGINLRLLKRHEGLNYEAMRQELKQFMDDYGLGV